MFNIFQLNFITMKKLLTVLFLFFLSFTTAIASSSYKEVSFPNDQPESDVKQMMEEYKSSLKDMSRKERKLKKKETRAEVKQAIKDNKGADTDTLLLVIIAIFIPPLAMAIYDGITTRFWLSLLLTLLFYLPGLIYTLIIILGGK